MKDQKHIDDHHCSVIERKRIKNDIAYCNAAHDTHEARLECYAQAEASSKKREMACKYS